MAPLPPSAVRGNMAGSGEQILLRPPSFEKFFKSARNMQFKTLQVERKFSHYEQKISNAPIDRGNIKMPRRLQTRKFPRGVKPVYDEEKIRWNERLAAWLREDQSSTMEYIKISEQFSVIEKELYYCSACHEFFHLNLHERPDKKLGCPRFKGHHEDHVKPVSIQKVKKPRRKQPTVVAKDPFGDRSNLKIPSLRPPKPAKRPVKVVVDIPRLPPVSKTSTSMATTIPTAESRNTPRKTFVSPASTSTTETTIREKTINSPIRLPPIFKSSQESTPQGDDSPEGYQESLPEEEEEKSTRSPELKPKSPIIDPLVPDEEAVDDEKQEPESDEVTENSAVKNLSQTGSPVVKERSSSVAKRKLVSFNDFTLNDISECSDVESVNHDGKDDYEEHDEDSANQEETIIDEVMDDDYLGDESEVEIELHIPSQSPELTQESPSPQRDRPRPPPPDLPNIHLEDDPDSPPPLHTKKQKPPLKKRKAMTLPPIKTEPKPAAKRPEPPKVKRMTSDEIARRMKKAKEIDGYRKKYQHDSDTGFEVTTDEEGSSAPSDMDLYDDSFLEKYCLVTPEHLRRCRRVFKKFDKDKDDLLKSEEVVNAIHKMFSAKVLDDVEMCYIFRILETTSFDIFTERMNLKLFAIIIALAEKISKLDPHMKHLVGRVNVEVVDWKLCRARQLFEQTMRRNAQGTYKVPMESLWLELHVGGITEEHEKTARRTLGHMKELDLLDFLAYLPLFLLVHSNAVENPLNADRHT